VENSVQEKTGVQKDTDADDLRLPEAPTTPVFPAAPTHEVVAGGAGAVREEEEGEGGRNNMMAA
jgi:hypothetical protein